ncbi:hypothetical protein TNIN_430101 [Trichonephila inaurata madagascariensis]|uniref:Uncharacterized protein n=1 Tax=Trichonephila inaurata madagascariensis TaxID=2747483 RepID=A0A8X7C838_9ARAC|nr:hypothetical protein TNIN_430101 [Trichonephila inaurata madagascariensis]
MESFPKAKRPEDTKTHRVKKAFQGCDNEVLQPLFLSMAMEKGLEDKNSKQNVLRHMSALANRSKQNMQCNYAHCYDTSARSIAWHSVILENALRDR